MHSRAPPITAGRRWSASAIIFLVVFFCRLSSPAASAAATLVTAHARTTRRFRSPTARVGHFVSLSVASGLSPTRNRSNAVGSPSRASLNEFVCVKPSVDKLDQPRRRNGSRRPHGAMGRRAASFRSRQRARSSTGGLTAGHRYIKSSSSPLNKTSFSLQLLLSLTNHQ